jgi:predicted enzyme related to lactoylglutathione lyase
MITEIAFFTFPVADVPRARRFYEGVLGLKMTHSFQDAWIEYDIGASTFAIAQADAEHRPALKGGAIAFEVDDFDTELMRLKDAGARFVVEPSSTPVCRLAILADPDGNEIIIHKRNA